jgi:hypothetical protein
MEEARMPTFLGVMFLLLAGTGPAAALTLDIVEVNAPAVNCVFDLSCTLVVSDSSAPITLPGGVGTGFLQSRSFSGAGAAPAGDLHGYEYRIALDAISGTSACIDRFSLDFGPARSLDYDGQGGLERVFVVTSGGLGSVRPTSAEKDGNRITFGFAPPVCAGQTSYFFGMASAAAPSPTTARIRETAGGTETELAARVPALPPNGCAPRPDLNADFTAAQRTDLATLMQTFLDVPVLNAHFTPGIHGSSLFLPWHREYISDLEDDLIAAGHPEFVPFPKWDPATPIPAEFTALDADCPALSGSGSCAALGNTDPQASLPAELTPPAVCAYASVEELRLGTVTLPSLEGFHNGVHGAVSGVMGNFRSPSAVIFWPWHSFIDDVWRSWECCAPQRPFSIRSLIVRTCPFTPCWPLWFGLDDPRLIDPARLTGGAAFEHGRAHGASGFLTVRDRRGTNNLGMLAGAPVAVPGAVGSALEFDGATDYVIVSSHPDLDVGGSDVSIDGWVRTTAAGYQPIIDRLDGTGAGYALSLLDGQISLQVGTAHFTAGGGPNLADGEWHHVAAVVDRAGVSRLYADGDPVHEFVLSAPAGSLGEGADLFIARGRDGNGAFFAGALDELDMFRFALTEDDVDGIFSAGAAGKFGALASLAPLVERPCLEELRIELAALPKTSARKRSALNRRLLARLDAAIGAQTAGDSARLARQLTRVRNRATRLGARLNKRNKIDGLLFHDLGHKADECLALTAGSAGARE